MCGQFPDPREWIREYVVNGYDAGARTVWIEGREDEETYTICVEDDGRGMDRKGVRDFVTVFRSVKSGDRCRIVGRHGVGKLSVAAVEGQCGYHMTTSTGTECWRMRTTCLLDDTPIVLERTDTPAPRGTRFEIAFRKNNASLRDEMLKLIEVLKGERLALGDLDIREVVVVVVFIHVKCYRRAVLSFHGIRWVEQGEEDILGTAREPSATPWLKHAASLPRG